MPGRVSSPRFVGRQAELASLRAAVDRLGSGATAAVLVGGEAGVGKSRLIGEVSTHATAAGVRVLNGACVALGAESLPYAPFTQALGELAAELGAEGIEELVGSAARADLARLVPELREPGDQVRPAGATDRAVLFHAVLRTLEAGSATAPLLLVIEDVHWADASSRELLGFLVGRLRGPVLIVATFRSDELHRRHPLRPLLAEATRDERVVRLDLAPLEPGEIAELLEAIVGSRPAAEIVAAVVARAEGNPFFAEELLAAGGGPELPPGLAEVLTEHLAELPEAAYEVVRVAAVAGRRVGHDLLAVVCGRAPAELAADLRAATFHHVLVADPTGAYAFRHALLQQAAYAELLPGERVALHGAYAAALDAHPEWAASAAGVAGELAHHFAAAREPARALRASVAAAAAAADTYALGEAHALYEQALALWEQVPEAADVAGCDRAYLLERSADAAVLAGANRRAVALVRLALDELDANQDPARAAMLHWRLARVLWTNGDGDASLVAHHAAVALMPAEPSAERALILAGEGHVLMLSAQYKESRARCEEAIEVARAAGARREEGYALNTLGADHSRLGDSESALACLEEALVIAEAVGSIEDVWRAYANLSNALSEAGQPERAVDVGRAGVTRLEELGYDEGAAILRCVCALALRDAGAWDEADRLAAEALQGPVSSFTAWSVLEVRATIAVRRGDFASAHLLLDEACGLWSSPDAEFRSDLDAVLVELALGEGRLDELRTLIDEGLDALADSEGQDHLQRLVALALRAEADEACRTVGRDTQARARVALQRADRFIRRSRATNEELTHDGVALTLRSELLMRLCEAEFARAHGRHAPASWAEVAQRWDRISQPYEVAYARWREAEAHLGSGDKEAASAALREAFAIASGLGAAPLTADIEALARRARVRTSTAPALRVDDDPRGGLSPREIEVLSLVAAGHTNREIAAQLYISDKTASVHVSHILTKLGVANRGQATAAAHRLNLVDKPPAS
jgi:DNA-binding CsgD family transcriptional regulator